MLVRSLALSGMLLLTGLGSSGCGEDRAVVEVRTLPDGRTVIGELSRIDASVVALRLPDGSESVIARTDLWSVSRTANSDTLPVDGHVAGTYQLVLTNGDSFAVDTCLIAGDVAEAHVVGTAEGATSRIPLEYIARVSCGQQATARALEAAAAADTLLLANGDRLVGEFLELTETRCRIETASGTRDVSLDRVAALLLDPRLTAVPPVTDTFADVTLSRGGRMTASALTSTGQEWQITSPCGFVIAMTRHAVRRVDFYSPTHVNLSRGAPDEQEHRPYLDRASEIGIDRNLKGEPLVVNGEPLVRGYCVAPYSRLTFDLATRLAAGGTAQFSSAVGLDDSAGELGSVEFVVLADDIEVWRSGRVTGIDPLRDIGPLPLPPARRLHLVVEFADHGDIGDIAVWGRPTLCLSP